MRTQTHTHKKSIAIVQRSSLLPGLRLHVNADCSQRASAQKKHYNKKRFHFSPTRNSACPSNPSVRPRKTIGTKHAITWHGAVHGPQNASFSSGNTSSSGDAITAGKQGLPERGLHRNRQKNIAMSTSRGLRRGKDWDWGGSGVPFFCSFPPAPLPEAGMEI